MKLGTSFLLIMVIVALPVVGMADDATPQGTVNLNTANAEQLQLLPRVGPSLAERIIAFREANGPFRTADELIAVKGIGESSYDKMSPYLTVSGETTLTAKVSLPRTTSTNDKTS